MNLNVGMLSSFVKIEFWFGSVPPPTFLYDGNTVYRLSRYYPSFLGGMSVMCVYTLSW